MSHRILAPLLALALAFPLVAVSSAALPPLPSDAAAAATFAPANALAPAPAPAQGHAPGCGHPVMAGLVPQHDVSAAPCPGIRPGGALILRFTPMEMVYCTMAFLVTDGADLYVATAGHCVDPSLGVPGLGERVSAHGVPGTFGTVVHQWCEGTDSVGELTGDLVRGGGCAPGTDFALIRIDADKRAYASPAMCAWGAPTGGVFTQQAAIYADAPLVVQHFGWGMGLAAADLGWNWGGVFAQPANPATQAREGLLIETDETIALVESAAISGDSGSGVLVTGLPDPLTLTEPAPQALGVLTHISVGGIGFVQRLDFALARAGAEMGTTFALVTE